MCRLQRAEVPPHLTLFSQPNWIVAPVQANDTGAPAADQEVSKYRESQVRFVHQPSRLPTLAHATSRLLISPAS